MDELEWPYFNDPVYSEEEFINDHAPKYYIGKDRVRAIIVEGRIVAQYHIPLWMEN